MSRFGFRIFGFRMKMNPRFYPQTKRSHLADYSFAEHLWWHVVDGAGRFGLDTALDVHLAREPKI